MYIRAALESVDNHTLADAEVLAHRERALAKTKLEESLMWFNRARAIETDNVTTTDFDREVQS